MRLPREAAMALAVAVILSFVGGIIGIIAGVAAAGLLMAYSILGFAVLHAVTRGMNARGFVLGAVYASVLVFGWPMLLLCLIGLADAIFDLRGRVARRPPAIVLNVSHVHSDPDQGAKPMEVILLERVGRLGHMGDVVRVKDGFARNFLLPQGKALRATADNRKRFEEIKSDLQAKNLEAKGGAEKLAATLDGKTVIVIRQASESGQLYGSVSTRDIASLLNVEGGATISRSQVALNAPIKTLGQHKVPLALHPEVETNVTVIVARSTDEAERIARGEDVTVRRTEEEEEAAAAAATAESFFEEGAERSEEGEEAEKEEEKE